MNEEGGFNRPWEPYDGRSKLCSMCGEGPILAEDGETLLVRGSLTKDWWDLCEACYGLVVHSYGKDKTGWPEWLIGKLNEDTGIGGLIATTRIQNNRDRVCRELDKGAKDRLDHIAKEHLAIQDEAILHYIEPDETTSTEIDITELGVLEEEDSYIGRLMYKGVSPESILIEQETRRENNNDDQLKIALIKEVAANILTETERHLFEQHWYEGKTQSAIAEERGMKQYQVSRILKRAQTKIKGVLVNEIVM